jgi:small subunit ribosomal protein S2
MVRILVVFFGLVLASAGVFLLFWVLWYLWKRSVETEETPVLEIRAAPTAARTAEAETESPEPSPIAEAEAEEPAEAPEPDDLKRIEGIGPKLSSVLQAAGITTFAHLADTEVEQLEQILEEADPRLLRLANPASWPEQASLAASGEWEALEALQSEMKAGRKM